MRSGLVFTFLAILLFFSLCFAVPFTVSTTNSKIFYKYDSENNVLSEPKILTAVRLLDPLKDVGKYDVKMELIQSGNLLEEAEKTIVRDEIEQVEQRTVVFPLSAVLSPGKYLVKIIAKTKTEYYLEGLSEEPVSDEEEGELEFTQSSVPHSTSSGFPPLVPSSIASHIPDIFPFGGFPDSGSNGIPVSTGGYNPGTGIDVGCSC